MHGLKTIGLNLKRSTCASCLRPQSACICQWVKQTEHAVEVLILQHPLEVHEAKGSARLLHLSLQHSQLVVGEEFESTLLQDLLTKQGKFPVLLYPDSPEDAGLGLLKPANIASEMLQHPERLRLVVLDGTWRKSRKMLYLNPLLQQLPRLPLHDTAPSKYLIRKAHFPNQLSTIEATCAALAHLEGNALQFAPLLAAFDGFVAQQMQHKVK